MAFRKHFLGALGAFLLLCATSVQSFAQRAPTYGYEQKGLYTRRYFHPGLSHFTFTVDGGASVYSGDLSGMFEPALQNYYLNPHFGIGINYRATHYLSFSLRATAFTLRSDDANEEERIVPLEIVLLDETDREQANEFRELLRTPNFRTYGGELSFHVLHELFPKFRVENGEIRFAPYATIGFGAAHWEVYTLDGQRARDANNLFSVGEDGEIESVEEFGEPYQDFEQFALVFPVGAGVRYYLAENLAIGLELNYRFTTTNFLDGHSDRTYARFNGEPTQNDAYSFFTMRVEHTFLAQKAYRYKTPRYYKNRRQINNKRRRSLFRKYKR